MKAVAWRYRWRVGSRWSTWVVTDDAEVIAGVEERANCEIDALYSKREQAEFSDEEKAEMKHHAQVME